MPPIFRFQGKGALPLAFLISYLCKINFLNFINTVAGNASNANERGCLYISGVTVRDTNLWMRFLTRIPLKGYARALTFNCTYLWGYVDNAGAKNF